MSATPITTEHYMRPDVREIITKFAMPGDGAWRCLNGDFVRWYGYNGDQARLLTLEDYDEIVDRYRTLYQSLNVFDPALWMVARKKDQINSYNPLGTPADTAAYTLGVDIDKGPGCDIEKDDVKQAVEGAAQFLVDYLRDNGVHSSVWVAFSGGGIYLFIHHEICRPETIGGRQEFFEMATDGFNRLISHISDKFFEAHPEHKGKVKFDALNNSKRIFKSILSIHKSKPYAVTPLNRDSIKIDFERARVPLALDMIEEAGVWYSTYDPAEREPLLKLLDTFRMPEEEAERKKRSGQGGEVTVLAEKIEREDFPPCIKHILDAANQGEGKTRFTAVLSAFLYQVGWSEEEARTIVKEVSNRNGLPNANHIFDSCFGRISCPSCKTIREDGAGYPHMGLKGLGACVPDGMCDRWPGDYGLIHFLSRMEQKPKGPTVLDAFKALLIHEAEAEKDKDFNRWNWRMQKPRIERVIKKGEISKTAEEKAYKFLKQYKDTLKKYGIDYDDLYPLIRKTKSSKEEFPPAIKAKALEILKAGDPVQYVADSCGRTVVGAETAFKKLCNCISVQNIRQSAGLHPKFNGDSGGGKTFIANTYANHLPREMVIKGSMSAKSGFYHKDGNRVLRLLDDYQAGNEDLDTVIKQTTSEFHEPYQHRTLIKQVAAILEIGSEQTWLITSVDSSQDIQVLNRQIPINVDDSVATTGEVNDRTVKRYGLGEEPKLTDETVLVCRAMFQILRDEGMVDVRVPFWERIKWLDTSNRRNPSIFLDMVVANTAMFRYQREKDSDGYYLATEADFQAAKKLFTDKDSEELVKRLTTRERDVIEKLVAAGQNGLTRDDLAAALCVAPERISQIISGQKGAGGLKQKVQIAETKKAETTTTNKNTDKEKRVTVFKTVYSLSQYDKWLGFDGVVRLEPDTNEPAPDEPDKPDKHGVSNGISKPTEASKDDISKKSKNKRIREREEIEKEVLTDGVSSSSLENEKKAYSAYTVELDNEIEAYTVLTEGLRGKQGDERTGIGPHPRKEEANTPTATTKCAQCGADLTGHATVEKGGHAYCARPGCGYPPREKGEAEA